jgi:hypothetical protein
MCATICRLWTLLEILASAIFDFLGYWWTRILKGDDV